MIVDKRWFTAAGRMVVLKLKDDGFVERARMALTRCAHDRQLTRA